MFDTQFKTLKNFRINTSIEFFEKKFPSNRDSLHSLTAHDPLKSAPPSRRGQLSRFSNANARAEEQFLRFFRLSGSKLHSLFASPARVSRAKRDTTARCREIINYAAIEMFALIRARETGRERRCNNDNNNRALQLLSLVLFSEKRARADVRLFVSFRIMSLVLQLTFDTFTVGRFLSFTSEGCPDGFMTIREEGRPATGGQWCGSAWGYTVYYSETPSINLTLYLLRLSDQVKNCVSSGGRAS